MSKTMPDSFDEFLSKPGEFGFCSFEEFRKNKKKWIGGSEDIQEAVDGGDRILGTRHKYFIENWAGRHEVDSISQAERIAVDMGLNLNHDFDIKPQLREDVSGRIYTEVTFLSKRGKPGE